jgi:putative ATP-dependent endonuclease of the OLD family
LRIRSIEIQNYKCYQKATISISSNFHTIIGANSSGKTSFIEACKLVRSLGNVMIGSEIVYGGITENSDPKFVKVAFVVELSREERDYYFSKYFHLSSELIEHPTKTRILNRVGITFGIRIRATKKQSNDDRVMLTEVYVSDTDDDFVQVLKLDNDGNNVFVSQFEPGIKGRIANNSAVNEHLRNLPRMSTNNAALPGMFQYDITQRFMSYLRFIPSLRQTAKEANSRYYEDFSTSDEEGSDLISLMLAMYLNKRDEFNKIEYICKRLFPDIEKIHPKQTGKDLYTVSIKKWNSPNEITLTHEGLGVDQLLIMIWLIATSKPESILFIDEPELHLHPGAQKLLYDFFIEEVQKNKQIFVTSHSMVFIYKSNLDQVTLLVYHENGTNDFLLRDLVAAEKLNTSLGIKEIREHLYKALGYDPVFAFEPQNIVMVEGRTDERILTSFSRTLGSPIDNKMVIFLIIGSKQDVKNFSPILKFAVSNKKCVIILDNDKSNPEDVKNSILNIEKNYREKINLDYPILTDKNFYSFPEKVYSIEYYLLEPEAICKAFNCTEENIMMEIKNEINTKLSDIDKKIIKPKHLLKEICEHHFQRYDEIDTPTKIAECTSYDHLHSFQEINELVELIAK